MDEKHVPFNHLRFSVGGRQGIPSHPLEISVSHTNSYVGDAGPEKFQATLTIEKSPKDSFYPFWLTVDELKRLANLLSDVSASWDGTEDVEMRFTGAEQELVLSRKNGVISCDMQWFWNGNGKSPQTCNYSLTLAEKELFANFVSTVTLHLSGQNVVVPSFPSHSWQISAIRNRV